MAKEIVGHKICPACLQDKPLSDFHKDRNKRDGLQRLCKACKIAEVLDYQRRHPGQKKYTPTAQSRELARKSAREFRKSPAGRAYYAIYNRTRDKQKLAARDAVKYAVSIGKLPPVRTLVCKCGKRARHYHHYKGYAKENHLDVVPLCSLCHAKEC